MPERLWRVLPWLILAILLLVVFRTVYPSVDISESYGAAPEFALLDLQGQPFHLADYDGHVVVINFWATWCPPCRAEIPGFVSLQDEFREDGVTFVGISLDDEGDEVVADFAAQRRINYPILLRGHRVAAAFGGVGVLPTTLLVDRSGHVRFRHEGFLLPASLRPAIRRLIEEDHVPGRLSPTTSSSGNPPLRG